MIHDSIHDMTIDQALTSCRSYQKVFTSAEGFVILGDMLEMLKFFRTDVDTPEDTALRNFAMILFRRITGYSDVGILGGLKTMLGKTQIDKDAIIGYLQPQPKQEE